MATPSFEKRLRRNAGNTVTFNRGNKTMTVVISKVVFDSTFGDYTLVGRNVSNIAKRGSPTVNIPTEEIDRPVRYSSR
jgi:hypothetical protein